MEMLTAIAGFGAGFAFACMLFVPVDGRKKHAENVEKAHKDAFEYMVKSNVKAED